jgi:enoyl-CoA hydratase/carnithine racemase
MTNVRYDVADRVATLTLDGPDRKNPLTFELYAQLHAWFASLRSDGEIKAVVLTGAGGNFCSGGDVHEIIGPLTAAAPHELLAFTQLTGELVKAMRRCPQPIVAAIDGVCAGAGAAVAMASDLRLGTERSKVAFLFVRVGLAGCDMGACTLLPRIIGLGRASELLYTGRVMPGMEACKWGFYNELCKPRKLLSRAQEIAQRFADGPTAAHAMTKRMLRKEWSMPLDDAIDAEARAQAACMDTGDFRRAYRAFVEKRVPEFRGE